MRPNLNGRVRERNRFIPIVRGMFQVLYHTDTGGPEGIVPADMSLIISLPGADQFSYAWS